MNGFGRLGKKEIIKKDLQPEGRKVSSAGGEEVLACGS